MIDAELRGLRRKVVDKHGLYNYVIVVPYTQRIIRVIAINIVEVYFNPRYRYEL